MFPRSPDSGLSDSLAGLPISLNEVSVSYMTVYAYVDTLPQPIKQGDVVKYFATRPEGPLIFTQSTLSCKLQHCSEMEAHARSNSNALSSKWPCVVTRLDVDQALWLWVQHMEQKKEVVNSAMLIAKRLVFKEALDVPEGERLAGPGWIQSFCHTWVNFDLAQSWLKFE